MRRRSLSRLNFRTIYAALRAVGKTCEAAGEPIITALVINQKTARCSNGLEKEFGIKDDAAERQRCYAYWRDNEPHDESGTAEPDRGAPDADAGRDTDNPGDAEDRLARFLRVQTRPEQPAFRKAVFEAYGGRCAISGCDIPEALEAAHLHGRNWREGDNTAQDGILLRRDLHTLYDRELLGFSEGVVWLSDRVLHHYGELEGVAVSANSGAEPGAT
ncbi:HNH endonuclease [Cupriavidus sp. CP313]